MDDLFGDLVAPSSSKPQSQAASAASVPPAATTTASFEDEEYDSVLFVARECYVYRLPARTSTAGYKAGDWGDMEAFLWKGRCRVIEVTKGSTSRVVVRLEDSNTGETFAQCPYDKTGKAVEAVLDSSRYFVLRVVDATSGKHAYLGMGFQERTEAFDFQVSLQDWQKRQRIPKLEHSDSSSSTASSSSAASSVSSAPKRDFSLKAGETISVRIGGAASKRPAQAAKRENSGGGAPIPLLAPPPPAGRSR